MNYRNCPKCGTANAPEMSFCQNCGASLTTADELPPTVVGMSPPITPPQNLPPNQPPPNFPPSQPPLNFQQQPMPVQSSGGKKIALIGGIIGLIGVIAGGIALWFTVIGPYFEERAWLKKQEENRQMAQLKTATSLLPEEYTTSTMLTFRKSKTMDKMQMLQASQNLPPELKSELKDINDAVAAEYINVADGNQKVILQIFKYNTPAQAVATCDKVGLELEKNRASFKEVYYDRVTERMPDYCAVDAIDKNEGYTGVWSLYGFLVIVAGKTESRPGAASKQVSIKLQR